ncbi:MAG: hypothetical protein LBE86_13540 [Gemmobacter sp.]|jgi:hypothetical protein|nr:hypothetical protein [Gemmobacter sp.]
MSERQDIDAKKSAAAPAAPHPRPARPDVEIERVRDDARLRVWRHRGRSRRLVVCFSGLGRDHRRPPRLEFAKTASASGRDHVLYIADPNRSWLNAPGLIEEISALVEAEVARVTPEHVVAMGHSMGGYSALALGGFTRVDVALALSPQLAVDPDVVPEELRWKELRGRIGTFRIGDVSALMRPETEHCIIFGNYGREAAQRRLIRLGPNVHSFLLPGVRHDTVQRLYKAGLLDETVQLAFDGRHRRLRRILADGLGAVQLPSPARTTEEDA